MGKVVYKKLKKNNKPMHGGGFKFWLHVFDFMKHSWQLQANPTITPFIILGSFLELTKRI